jgi:uncharacterized membrane protein
MTKKRYWLRGGLIAAVLFLLNYTLGFFEYISCLDHQACGLVAYLPSLDINQAITRFFYPMDDDISIWLVGIIFVIFGILLGWLYGKMKDKTMVK